MNANTGLCQGCYRTLDEIACWARLDDARKQDILTLVAARRQAAANP